MALSAAQMIKTIRDIVASTDPAPMTLTRPDLQAAISAADTWATNNSASFNQALPEPFKSTATAAQKAALLAYVCLRRAGA